MTSWKKSLSQASIYVRADRDEDDPFIRMKNTGELCAKNKVIQGSTRQRAHFYHPNRQREEQGIKGMLKRILRKIDYIGRNQVKMVHNQVKHGLLELVAGPIPCVHPVIFFDYKGESHN